MTTTTILTKAQFNEWKIANESVFDRIIYDCSSYVDLKALKKSMKSKKTIKKVLVFTRNIPCKFKNIANVSITYSNPVACCADDAGAFIHTLEGSCYSYHAILHPLGDAFVVI